MGKYRAIKHLLLTYVAATPKVVSGMLNIFHPKKIQFFVHEILNICDLESDCSKLSSVDIREVRGLSFRGDIAIRGTYYNGQVGGTHQMSEIALLAYMCQAIKPRIIFEFGTFVGETTRLFALNTDDDTKIITLDLPKKDARHKVGACIIGTKESEKVQMCFGDSRYFDYSKWEKRCDLVWVDACHDYEHVVSDTKEALKLVRPGGWIMWHDYRQTSWWSGVTRHLWKMKKLYPKLVHIKGTTIAMLKAPNSLKE